MDPVTFQEGLARILRAAEEAFDRLAAVCRDAFVDPWRAEVERDIQEMLDRADRKRLACEERAALGYVPPPRRPPAEVRARAADRRAALAPPRRLWRPRRPT